ncbi:hypothetical protein BV25DRAFT_1840040 [Artomyces pyxidatus]|uniref:Uncharacterized protein n=1 Tax=Artomyces pyxidatus TaxID=48021 RepID=A0ACB8SVT1_9AGAM|nr:hypothetical protein BV25DRAFT_1840040 [Artomyces pyxidatus]
MQSTRSSTLARKVIDVFGDFSQMDLAWAINTVARFDPVDTPYIAKMLRSSLGLHPKDIYRIRPYLLALYAARERIGAVPIARASEDEKETMTVLMREIASLPVEPGVLLRVSMELKMSRLEGSRRRTIRKEREVYQTLAMRGHTQLVKELKATQFWM